MQYKKHFVYQGITIIFDKLEYVEGYLYQYVVIKDGKIVAFIPKLKIKVTYITKVTSTYKIVTFGFCE